jgi:hypothetical protein
MTSLTPEVERNVDERARIATALGTPLERKLARIRLGLTQKQVAEMTGMPVKSIRLRETRDPQRRTVDIETEVKYARLIARARGVRL